MAILTSLPGVEVTVEVAGEPLQEYHDTDASDRYDTITNFIEAQSNRAFTIKIVTKPGAIRGAGLSYRIMLDGNRAEATTIQPYHCEDGESYEHISKGWPLGAGRCKQFKFRSLVTDESGTNNPNRNLQDLGVIQVNVFHVSKVSKTGRGTSGGKIPKTKGRLSEKSVKGRSVSHTVGFGKTLRAAGTDKINVEYMTEDPIGIFKFMYRSREALKSELIIPRTPSPPPVEDRDAASLAGDVDQIAELQKQLKEMKERLEAQEKIKQEDRDESPRPKKRTRPSSEVEIIELD